MKLSTHSQQLERWIGGDTIEHLSRSMNGWYGPPIALAGVPGEVFATGDGDFIGRRLAAASPAGLSHCHAGQSVAAQRRLLLAIRLNFGSDRGRQET